MNKIKFAINLDSISSDVFNGLNASDEIIAVPPKITSSNDSNTSNNQIISATNKNVFLPSGTTLETGTNFIKDSEEELTLLRFTAFQSFPVKYTEKNKGEVVTMVLDGRWK